MVRGQALTPLALRLGGGEGDDLLTRRRRRQGPPAHNSVRGITQRCVSRLRIFTFFKTPRPVV